MDAQSTTVRAGAEQRRANRRTALLLAAIAIAFFAAMIVSKLVGASA